MLSSREELLEALEEAYAELGRNLPVIEGNPCGECFSCCTSRGLTNHFVSDLEHDLIARERGEETDARFKSYLNREHDADGQLKYDVCPNYDRELHGCSVHSIRPFSCRVFGHYRPLATRMPEGCVFEGKTHDFEWPELFHTVPSASRVRQLARERTLFGPPVIGELRSFNHQIYTDHFNQDDPIDRAMTRSLIGDLAGAVEELTQADDPETNFRDYALGMIYGFLQRPREAVVHYLKAAARVPLANFFYYAGFHLMSLQDYQRAEQVLCEGLGHDPQHSLILGGLGTIAGRDGRLEDALVFFERASAAAPANGFFVLRQGTTLLALGRLPEARARLTDAALFAGFREEAEQLISKT